MRVHRLVALAEDDGGGSVDSHPFRERRGKGWGNLRGIWQIPGPRIRTWGTRLTADFYFFVAVAKRLLTSFQLTTFHQAAR